MNDQPLTPLVRDHDPEDSIEAELAELLSARDPLPRLPAATVARLRVAAIPGGGPPPRRQLPLVATAAAMLLTGAPLAAAWVHVWPQAVRGLAALWQPARATLSAPVERHPLVPPPLPSSPAALKPAPQAASAVTPSARSVREQKSAHTVARTPIARTGSSESAAPIPSPALPPAPKLDSATAATALVAPARIPNEDAELVAEGNFLKTLVRPSLPPAEVLAILAEYRQRFPKQQLGGAGRLRRSWVAHIAMRQCRPKRSPLSSAARRLAEDARLAELHVLSMASCWASSGAAPRRSIRSSMGWARHRSLPSVPGTARPHASRVLAGCSMPRPRCVAT